MYNFILSLLQPISMAVQTVIFILIVDFSHTALSMAVQTAIIILILMVDLGHTTHFNGSSNRHFSSECRFESSEN